MLPNLIDTPEKIDALYFCLADLSDDEFGRGVQILALTHKEFYPNTNIVAILRDYALGDDTKTGIEAWGEVTRALIEMSRTPRIPYPDMTGLTPEQQQEAWARYNEKIREGTPFQVADPIADRIARAMGIKQLRYSQNEEVDRAHFIRAYDQLKAAEKRQRVAGRVAR